MPRLKASPLLRADFAASPPSHSQAPDNAGPSSPDTDTREPETEAPAATQSPHPSSGPLTPSRVPLQHPSAAPAFWTTKTELVTLQPHQSLVPPKFQLQVPPTVQSQRAPKLNPKIWVLHHPARKREWCDDRRDMEFDRGQTAPLGGHEGKRELVGGFVTLTKPGTGTTESVEGARETEKWSGVGGGGIGPRGQVARVGYREQEARAEMYGFQTRAVPLSSATMTPAYTDQLAVAGGSGAAESAISTTQLLLLIFLLLALHIAAAILYLINFPPQPGSWSAKLAKPFAWLARRPPRALRKVTRQNRHGYTGISTDNPEDTPSLSTGSGTAFELHSGARSAPPTSTSFPSTPRFSPDSSLRHRRSPRTEQAPLLPTATAYDPASPTGSDPEDYRAWLRSARRTANADVEFGTSSPEEVAAQMPSAPNGTTGAEGWLGWVAGRVEEGAEKAAGMLHRHVERGGQEEGLLLPVRRRERESGLGGSWVRGWERSESD